MNAAPSKESAPEFTDVCTIVVVYDNDPTRTRALGACDFLVSQFWKHVELEFHWWRTDFLHDPHLARAAAANARAADFLIVSSDLEAAFSPELESWFESWVDRRQGPEGALVDLRPLSRSRDTSGRERFLRDICQRAGFEYFTAVPGGDAEGAKARKPQVDRRPAANIDDAYPPSHFGLNE